MNKIIDLEDCINWIYQGYNKDYWWVMRKEKGMFQYHYCERDGQLSSTKNNKWENWPLPGLLELNNTAFKRINGEGWENLSPVCYKIRQMENRFKEAHA